MKLKKIIKNTLYEYLNEDNENDFILNKNFWKWFGNSKVVDNGLPLICYHGTIKHFKEFKIEPFKYSIHGNTEGIGIYFTSKKNLAQYYGPIIYECFLRIEKPIYGMDYEFSDNELSYLGYYKKPIIKYENTYIGNAITIKTNKYLVGEIDIDTIDKNIDPKNYKYKERKKTYRKVINDFSPFYPKINIYKKITDLGYDGYIGTDFLKHTDGIYVVFNPNQIKSIKNDGTWDINDNNIYS